MFIPILDYSYGAVMSSDEQNFLSSIFLFEFSYFCKYCVVISLFLLLVSYFIMNFFKFILIIPSALGVFNFFEECHDLNTNSDLFIENVRNKIYKTLEIDIFLEAF